MKKLIIAVCMTLPAADAAAMQNLNLGGFDIKPVVSSQEKYDTNIYLTRDLVKASLINRSSGGLGFMNKEGARLSIKGGYSLEGLFYTRAHRINDAVHHNANMTVGYELSGGRTITAEDKYMATTDQATSELTARSKRVQNVGSIAYESPLKGKFGFGVDGQHTFHDYLSPNNKALDRAEMAAGMDLHYKVQPKTKLFASYHYGMLRYAHSNANTNTRTNDAVYSDVDAGVTGKITSRLTGTLKGGAQFRLYKKDLANASNSRTTGGYSAQLNWRAAEKTEVVWFGKRGNVESTYGDSRFYVSTLNDIGFSREINKFKAGIGGGYEALRYPEETAGSNAKRHDGITTARATLDYNLQKWLKAGAGYSYKTRVSNERTNNYVDNIVTLEIKGMF